MNPLEPAFQIPIDAYLAHLHKSLGKLPPDEVTDILREIRGHIIERAEAKQPLNEEALTQILRSVGKPEDIGSLYQTRAMVARARVSASPVFILRTTIRWAGKSIAGLATCLFALFGYGLGLGILVCASLKPFYPERVGLWVGSHRWNLSMGTLTAAEQARDQAHEVLGWWLIPFGLITSALVLIVTTMILRWTLRFAFRTTAVPRNLVGWSST